MSGIVCEVCNTPLFYIDEPCPNCLPFMADRPRTRPESKLLHYKSCSSNHTEIWYDTKECPLCELQAKLIERAEMNWKKTKEYFDGVHKAYKDLRGTPGVNVDFALRHVFEPLVKRYDSGERTKKLFDEMMDVK